jgi:hypothetical protein
MLKFLQQQQHNLSAMEQRPFQKRASLKSQKSKGNLIIILPLFAFMFFVCGTVKGQETGFSVTVGYSPRQSLESEGVIKNNGQTVHIDAQYLGFGDDGLFGCILGIGIRSYRTDGFTTYQDDPYAKRTTRFDLHGGVGLKFAGYDNMYGLMIHPQVGIGYAGVGDTPELYFPLTLNADIFLFNWITIGVTYRPFPHSIVSRNLLMNDYGPAAEWTHHQVKPAWEFRIGILHFTE